MEKPPLHELVGYLAVQTWPAMKGHYVPHCCVPATRICLAVLEYFEYQGEIMHVIASAINSKLWDLMTEFLASGIADPLRDAAHIKRLDDEGAFQVILGHPKQTDKINNIGSHLIVKVSDEGQTFYLDPSITQADRPQRGLSVPVGLAFPESQWVNGSAYIQRKDTHFIYKPHPTPDPTYKQSPDWRSDRWSRFAGKLIRGARDLENDRQDTDAAFKQRTA